MKPKLVIGMFGFGTVGGGVVSLLAKNEFIKFKKIFVKNKDKQRDVKMPNLCTYADTPEEILNDSEINCVVEVMGGIDLAKTVILESIKRLKHVVTANKAVIATCMDEIQELCKEKNGKVSFQFEGAVCGGIPIIQIMKRSLVCDEVESILGIMNGTTNFMISRMDSFGESFQGALQVAQKEGYAEADPTADVDGHDTAAKLCILAKLAFGYSTKPENIFCQGIRNVSDEDFQYAKMINHTIKLLGICSKIKNQSNDKFYLEIAVAPALIPLTNPLSSIMGVTNGVLIRSSNLALSCFSGPGAGRFPTANSVVADILNLASHPSAIEGHKPLPFPIESSIESANNNFESEFYVRFVVDDKYGIIHEVSALFSQHKISIFSILQIPITNVHRVPFVVITEKCRLYQVQDMCNEMKSRQNSSRFSFLVEEPFFMLRIS